ncbi:30S ribosomal protein S15 [Labeo rohita]|uniref:30S ribosomal protein S15 n=1 Tax=Labeo rohita TaxID=84645 RepID=A0ABQ8L364_LABRO|nr:30S ribosomal protein S15 [Labeo rohita]
MQLLFFSHQWLCGCVPVEPGICTRASPCCQKDSSSLPSLLHFLTDILALTFFLKSKMLDLISLPSHSSLVPMLTKAVKKNKAILAVKFLGKAQVWIKEIISEVDRIVEKYELHNKDVASSTKELAEIEIKVNSKSQEIQEFARSITQTSKDLDILAVVVLFFGLIVRSIYDSVHDPENVACMKALEAERNNLIADKTALKQKQWQLELQIIDWQMKFAKANFDRSKSFILCCRKNVRISAL